MPKYPVTALDYYFTRMIDFTILADDSGQCIYLYFKFLKFVVWSTIWDVRPKINKELIISKNEEFINASYYLKRVIIMSNVYLNNRLAVK
jgi:hypothetical protein